MDEDASALAAAIGDRVRHERQGRQWTLDQLAEAAGVSRRALVNVEQGNANPSVGTLLRLSDALGIGLPSLVEPPRQRAVRITRAGAGAALWRSTRGGRAILLGGTEPPDVVEVWDWRLGARDQHTSEAHSAGTREIIEVRQGAVEVEVAGERHLLDVGDTITYPGDVPHAYRNPARQPARFALTVFEPGVGPGVRLEVDSD